MFWLRGSFEKHWNVPHGIYATGQLMDIYHVHKQRHGAWPEPGTYVAKEVTFVRSFDNRGVRVDVFNFGGGQYAWLFVHKNSLEILPMNTDRPSNEAR